MKKVMLTGTDGAIGALVLKAVAAEPEVEQIYVLSGGPAGAADNAQNRAAPPRGALGAALQTLVVDLQKPRFGLDEKAFVELCASVDTIFHCAERTSIDQDLQTARAFNTQPIATFIEMLQQNPAARLAQLSTTLVAGNRRGLFTEFDLACGQNFHNAYEQSKFEAERMLRDSAVMSRVIVFRRSLTADKRNPSPAKHVASPLASLIEGLRAGKLMVIAGDPHMHLDAVPLSYVAESMVALAQQKEALGKTLHLVAGWSRPWPLAHLVATIRGRFGRGRARFMPPALSILARVLNLLSFGFIGTFPGRRAALLPYFRHRCIFDNFQARALLEPLGHACPVQESCLTDLLGAVEQK